MPNQGVPVIFKNKIAYGYAEKSVQAYDVSVSDYNALTEQQQLDGSIRFIQGVDAIPNGSNVWAKLGTTPLAEGLPRDCSQAVNQLKSNLTQITPLTSSDHTISGYYVQIGNLVVVSGTFTATGVSNETININLPKSAGNTPLQFRNASGGSMGDIYFNPDTNNISLFNHTGTISANNNITFSGCYIVSQT